MKLFKIIELCDILFTLDTNFLPVIHKIMNISVFINKNVLFPQSISEWTLVVSRNMRKSLKNKSLILYVCSLIFCLLSIDTSMSWIKKKLFWYKEKAFIRITLVKHWLELLLLV